jgi:beta-galactosidase
MAKAMGLNTVCTYVFWNYHETKRGEFDFTGERDVAEFVRIIGEEGMKAMVRPGPYVCAEWDLGGLPAWLLAEPGVRLRSADPRFLEPAKAWMKRMGEMVRPLSVARGGPVLMVQLENEYGNFGEDAAYLAELERALRSGGYEGMIFTGDGASAGTLRKGGLPGVLKAANFGRNAESAFRALKEVSPGQPAFTAEFWVGWFDQWERPHRMIASREKMKDFEFLMRTGASFNLYMFHGGSTRGLWSGANREDGYRPTTDGYDYSAPLDESGRPTEKYEAMRWTIQRSLKGEKLPDVPKMPPTAGIGTLAFTERLGFLEALPGSVETGAARTMEALGQSTGFLLYRTGIEGPLEGELALGAVKDRVHVILNGEVLGISGRSTKNGKIPVKIPAGSHRLDLLVENMGRINYGSFMNDERKGLEGPLTLGGRELGPFEHVCLPMQVPPAAEWQEIKEGEKPGRLTFLKARFKVGKQVDTFLDFGGFGRGIVWLNGRNLGRYWKAGPPGTVFAPGCWMKTDAENEIVILELEAETPPASLRTRAEAVWLR